MSIQVIDENKAKFEALVRSIKREGADVEGLLNYLEDCDFYFAPKTSKEGKFAYDGGLCAHSIETYQAMCGMVYASLTEEKDWISIQSKEDWKESVKIVALFHLPNKQIREVAKFMQICCSSIFIMKLLYYCPHDWQHASYHIWILLL